MTGEFLAEILTPADIETAVRRPQWCDGNTALREQRHPCAIGTEPRPTAAAQREHYRIGMHGDLTLPRSKTQRDIFFATPVFFAPAAPAMAHVKTHSGLAQAVQPRAQQRRGFHLSREHAPGAADECRYAEAMHPFLQRLRPEGVEQRLDLSTACAVA